MRLSHAGRVETRGKDMLGIVLSQFGSWDGSVIRGGASVTRIARPGRANPLAPLSLRGARNCGTGNTHALRGYRTPHSHSP